MRERKDKSSGASSGRDRNAKSRAKRSPNPEPGAHQTTSPSRGAAKGKLSSDAASKRDAKKRDRNDTIAPGAHQHTSPLLRGSANDRIARKARHADSGSSAESSTNPGAQHTSAFAGSAKTRIARKARHADGGASAESANHNNRSTGLSSNPSRIEAKLREVGLGEENTTTNNVEVIPEKEEKVPSAYQVEAELIEDDYEGNQRQPYPGAVGDVQPSFEDNQADDESISTRKKRPWGIIVVVLLLVIGGGALAAWFFLKPDPPLLVETNAPTSLSSSSPSSSPSSTSFSGFPSMMPTIFLLYDPPSIEDCDAIALNQTIAGREEMEGVSFELGLEVVLSAESTMTPPLVSELLSAIQEKILPSLAGCSIDLDQFVEAWRFVIFDAFVSDGNVQPDESCKVADFVTQNCHDVSVKLDVFLKGRVRFLDIIRLISAETVNFANLHLGLSDVFLVVKMNWARGLTPTTSPTIMPSDEPSWTPS